MATYNAGSAAIDIVPNLDKFADELRAQLRRVDVDYSVDVSANLDASGYEARLAELTRDRSVDIRADVSGTAEANAQLDRAARDRKSKIDVDVDPSRLLAISSLVAGIGGGIGAAGGLVGGLALGFVGLGAAATPALATIALGFEGIKNAAKTIQPEFDQLKQSVSQTFSDQLAPTFAQLGQAMTTLTPQIQGIAGSISGVADGFLQTFTSAQGLQVLTPFLQGVSTMIDSSGAGIVQLSEGLRGMLANLTPALGAIGAAVGNVVGSLGSALGSIPTALFQQFAQVLSAIGPLLQNLIGAFSTLAQAVMPTLGPLFAQLGQALTTIAPALGQLGAAFVQAITPLLPVVAQLVSTLAGALAPIMPVLSQALQSIGNVLLQVLPMVAPVFQQLVEAAGQLLAAVLPLVPPLVQLTMAILQPLIGIIQTVVAALAPFIEQLASAFKPVIDALAAILAQVGQVLGQALAQAVQTLVPIMMPLTQVFLQLVQALLPLVPPLLNIAVQLLPLMFTGLRVLAPILTELLKLFVQFCNAVLIPIVVPALKLVGDWVGKVVQFTTNLGDTWQKIMQSVGDWAGKAKDWIVGAFGDVVGFFTGLPDKIRSATAGLWDGIKDSFRSAINWLIQKWNDFHLGFDFKIPVVGKHVSFDIDTPNLPLLATGGSVSGPGGPRDDLIPAMLSNGEYVINAAAVGKYGLGLFDAINAQRFADGGPVVDEPWVKTLGSQWHVTGSTYPGHQETDRHEDGYAPNPQHQNRGIDWAGAVDDMQKFAEHLLDIAPDTTALEQIIWQNPVTGQQIGWHGRTKDDGSYYADDYPQHTDHVHIRATGDITTPDKPAQTTPPDSPQTSSTDTGTQPQQTAAPSAAASNGPTSWSDVAGTAAQAAAKGLVSDALGVFGIPDSPPLLAAYNQYQSEVNKPDQQTTGTTSPGGTTTTDQSGPAPAEDKPDDREHVYDPAGGAEQWRSTLAWAINRVGQGLVASPPQLDAGVSQINSESGGDPNIEQTVQDINSANGDPAVGLLQLIGATFSANRDPQLPDDRKNPRANITAALRYYVGRYGTDLTTQWGHGHGYALGGLVGIDGPPAGSTDTVPAWLTPNEFVVNRNATAANLPALEAMNAGARIGGGQTVTYNISTARVEDAFREAQRLENVRAAMPIHRW